MTTCDKATAPRQKDGPLSSTRSTRGGIAGAATTSTNLPISRVPARFVRFFLLLRPRIRYAFATILL